MKKILLTGGAGYIGSHTAIELIQQGYSVVIADNLSNSSAVVIQRLEKLTNTRIPFYQIDISNKPELDQLFNHEKIDGVIHFAGFKSVGESVSQPLTYYRNNLDSTITLCEVMQEHSVKTLIFSSSATVYGTPTELPIKETAPTGSGITNPYGWTKYMIEQILYDLANANPSWSITTLRYFNPIGAHESGQIGEDSRDVPNNLMPYVAQTAVGRREHVNIFGDDYSTPDGTGVRDYIHVVDLAAGHVAALEHIKKGVSVYNLGTGMGTSVIELIGAFSKACGHEIPSQITSRRPGDIAACYASAQKAADELGWKAKLSVEDACRDAWKWQTQNPDGYTTKP